MADTYLDPSAMNLLLNFIDSKTTRVHITTAFTTDYSQVAGVSLGSAVKPSLTVSDIVGENGRELSFNDFTVSVTNTGLFSHIIFVDDVAKSVVIAKPIFQPKQVEQNATVTIQAEDIEVITEV